MLAHFDRPINPHRRDGARRLRALALRIVHDPGIAQRDAKPNLKMAGKKRLM